MNKKLSSEILRLGGDPTDEVWRWLILRGPHGPDFTWGQTKSEPAGYVGYDLLVKVIQELQEASTGFKEAALLAARTSLKSLDPVIVRRGIQALSVLGDSSDRETIKEILQTSRDETVLADARACDFVLRRKR